MGTRYFFYDGDRIIAEREGNSWVVRHLVSLSPFLPVGFVSSDVSIYHSDRLGSVRYVTDANQNILVSYVYEGFGKVIAQNGGGGGPYQFCGLWGYRNDWDAGLLHVGARYYEPETGRFIQKDRLELNTYVYCSNQPIGHVDPTGHTHYWWKFIAAILDPIITERLPEMPWPLPPWKPPITIEKPPFLKIEPPYPIPAPLPFEIVKNVFITLLEYGAKTFWGPPGGPRPIEAIIVSPIEALIVKRSGLTLDDLGLGGG